MTDLDEIEKCLAHGRCHLCGGFIGPDHTLRPMCYRCAPREATPDRDWAAALVAELRATRAEVEESEEAFYQLTKTLEARAAELIAAETQAEAFRMTLASVLLSSSLEGARELARAALAPPTTGEG